jgi:hypothetical protein
MPPMMMGVSVLDGAFSPDRSWFSVQAFARARVTRIRPFRRVAGFVLGDSKSLRPANTAQIPGAVDPMIKRSLEGVRQCAPRRRSPI